MRVTLLTRAGCPLCEEVEEMLRRLSAEEPLDFTKVDIDGDPALREAYDRKVPVVAVEGRPLLWGRIEEGVLRKRVRRAACRFRRSLPVAAFLLAAWALLAPRGARAGDAYRWTDEVGVVHVTDDPTKIPPRYRKATEAIEMTGRPLLQAPSASPAQPSPGRSSAPAPLETDKFGCNKACWQEKVRRWQDRLHNREARKAEIESEIMTTNVQAYPFRVGALRRELASVEEEIASIHQTLDVELPEEARTADAPPGWLRDVK